MKNKKKIGIVSQLRWDDCNYGSKLQAYALNYYINNNYSNIEADSLIITGDYKHTGSKPVNYFILRVINKIKRTFPKKVKDSVDVSKRNATARNFIKNNIKLNEKVFDYNTINASDYDMMIVGSDVVWMQYKSFVNRTYFLDFDRNFKKISYAASFGRDYIPKENVYWIKKYLQRFDAISVREKSSLKMLESIGVKNATHVCDPTILLDKNHWSKVGKKVEGIGEK